MYGFWSYVVYNLCPRRACLERKKPALSPFGYAQGKLRRRVEGAGIYTFLLN